MDKMAKKEPRAKPSAEILALALQHPAAKPTISVADKTYLKGLVRRGYTVTEIVELGKKLGFILTIAEMTVKPKNPKVDAVAPASPQPRGFNN